MENERILERVYRASLKLLATSSINDTYKTIVEEAIKLVNGKNGSIFLAQDGVLYRVYTTNPKLYTVIPRKKGYGYRVYKTNRPLIKKTKVLSKSHPLMGMVDSKYDMIIPLSYEKKAIGTLAILSKKNQTYTKSDLKILQLFGPIATLAILNSQYLEETKKALETRDLFISMASHELKTPITTVYAYMQLMKKKLISREAIKDIWIDTPLKETKRLSNLVNELLHISQIQTGNLQFVMKKINLLDVLNQAINDFSITHPKYTAKLQIDKNKKFFVKGDNNKLLQVFINLLNNAAKHSKYTEEIQLSLTSTESNYEIKIADKGTGIPKEELPNIFERFYRVKNNKKEGMGLGLFLSKNIIDEHSGQISIDSIVNKGTTITIVIPKIA